MFALSGVGPPRALQTRTVYGKRHLNLRVRAAVQLHVRCGGHDHVHGPLSHPGPLKEGVGFGPKRVTSL
eukprot:4553629-Alexandrium_andersonii.AAC.1